MVIFHWQVFSPQSSHATKHQEMEAEKEDSEDEDMEDDGADVPRALYSQFSGDLGSGGMEELAWFMSKNAQQQNCVVGMSYFFHV